MQRVRGELEAGAASIALTQDERDEGFFLACVSRPLEDCVVDARGMGLTESEFSAGEREVVFLAELERNERLTEDIHALRLRLLEPKQMRFTAGQFVNVELPGSTEARTYSLANAPSQNGQLDLIVNLRRGGRFSSLLSNESALGSRFRVFGPFGQLRIRLSHRPIILVANGSGISPMLSMLTDLAEKGSTRKVRLFFGVRAAEDLFALEQLAEIGRAMPSFELVPVLSREWPADWPGETGPLAAAIRRRVASAVDHDAYLCGAPWCIESTLPVLLELGIRRRNVHFDLFTPAAR